MINSEKNRKNIVILTVYFPPKISTASNRLLAFAKYLDHKKFNITVICTDEGNDQQDQSGLSAVRIIRIKNKKHPFKILFKKNDSFVVHKMKAGYNRLFNQFITDEYTDWSRSVFEYIVKNYKQDDIDIMISSFPTVAPHLVALKLKKSNYRFKWIADMRDGMSQNPFNLFFQKRHLRQIEIEIIKLAWCITTTTPPLVHSFKTLAGNFPLNVHEIRNGFDFDLPDQYNFNSVFTICHAGTFYADIKPFRFLEAIEELHNEKLLPAIKINFIGAGNAISVPEILKDFVFVSSKIPHSEAKTVILQADANLLLSPKSISDYLPGKLYEYIASQKPVILITAKGSESEILVKACRAGFVAYEHSIDEIKEAIMAAYLLWESKSRLSVDNEYLSQFHRKNQVKKLEQILLSDH